jgi:hypothetical protein
VAEAERFRLLDARTDQPSWLNETRSLRNGGACQALALADESAALVYRTGAALSHYVFVGPAGSHAGGRVTMPQAQALLAALHHRHPVLPAHVENVPADSPLLSAFEALGYRTAFRRIEMERTLGAPFPSPA